MDNSLFIKKQSNQKKKLPTVTSVKLKLFISVLLSFIICILIQYSSLLAKKDDQKYSIVKHHYLHYLDVKIKEEYDNLLFMQQKYIKRYINLGVAGLKKKLFLKGFFYTYHKWFLIAIDLFNVLQLILILLSYCVNCYGILILILAIYDLGTMICFTVNFNAFRTISYFVSFLCRIGYLGYSWNTLKTKRKSKKNQSIELT
jgi:hypothetical protein